MRTSQKTESADHSGQITFRNTVLTRYIHLNHIYKDAHAKRIMSPDTEDTSHMLIVHVCTYGVCGVGGGGVCLGWVGVIHTAPLMLNLDKYMTNNHLSILSLNGSNILFFFFVFIRDWRLCLTPRQSSFLPLEF